MSSLLYKIKKAIVDPRSIIGYVKRLRQKQYPWEETNGSFKRKKYKKYTDYIKHQKSKLGKIQSTWLPEYDVRYRQVLKERLLQHGVITPDMTVLCLAARVGTEVKSFLDLNCFAVGIDLNPGVGNKYVLYGDFHQLQFADNSIDIIFTNSLDHVFNLDKFIAEIKRVLKSKSFFILEVMKGEAEGNAAGYRYYEALSWKKVDELLTVFLRAGFDIVKKSDFSYPFNGVHVVFAKK